MVCPGHDASPEPSPAQIFCFPTSHWSAAGCQRDYSSGSVLREGESFSWWFHNQLSRSRSRRATPVGPREFHSPWADCIGAKLQLLLLAPGRERCEFCSVQVTTVLSLIFIFTSYLFFKWPSNVLKPRIWLNLTLLFVKLARQRRPAILSF